MKPIYFAPLAAALAVLVPNHARATIQGVTGTSFNLTAREDTISTGDGDSMYMWGYALDNRRMQYPGPTLIVNQGDGVTVRLSNKLPVPVSLVFPGHNVTATGGVPGLLTSEVPAAPSTAVVTYTFTASEPGTYIYYSGTRSDLQVEMGLAGALIVRPRGAPKQAYGDPRTAFDREYLFFLTEADPAIHQLVAFGKLAQVDMTARHPVDWFINGRNFPDTVQANNVSYLPTQPYNCFPRMHPGEKVLLRMVSAGVDLHPFHTHGQNHLVIARDGRLLSSNLSVPNPIPDLAISDYTTSAVPGETVDAIWGPWTGAKLGWDIYGTANLRPHNCTPDATGFDPASHEWCADHYKPIPVLLPTPSELTHGNFYGGTAYLGIPGGLPADNPGARMQQNLVGGVSFMWHSHSERELTTNDIFIGGMATMAMVVPMNVPIP